MRSVNTVQNIIFVFVVLAGASISALGGDLEPYTPEEMELMKHAQQRQKARRDTSSKKEAFREKNTNVVNDNEGFPISGSSTCDTNIFTGTFKRVLNPFTKKQLPTFNEGVYKLANGNRFKGKFHYFPDDDERYLWGNTMTGTFIVIGQYTRRGKQRENGVYVAENSNPVCPGKLILSDEPYIRRLQRKYNKKVSTHRAEQASKKRQASNSGSGFNWGKAFAIVAGAALANSSDMSSSDKAEFMESYTKDVLNDTGGTNTRALGERVERDMQTQRAQNEERDRRWNEQNRKREERESKYYREGAKRSKAYSEGRYVKKVKPKEKKVIPLPKAHPQANTQVAKNSQPSYMNDPRIIEGIWKRADGTVIEVAGITKWAVGGSGRFVTYGEKWKKYFRKYREINGADTVPPAMKLRSINFQGKGTWSCENLWWHQRGDNFRRDWKPETIMLKDKNNFSIGGSDYKRQ